MIQNGLHIRNSTDKWPLKAVNSNKISAKMGKIVKNSGHRPPKKSKNDDSEGDSNFFNISKL